MAAGDGHVFNNFKEQLLLGTIDLSADTVKVALYTDAFAAGDIDGAAPAYSATNEFSGSGYSAGGGTLASKAVAQDDTNDRASFDANDYTWTSLAAGTVQQAIIYDDTTTPKHMICAWEIGTNPNGGNYTLQWHSNGILLLS